MLEQVLNDYDLETEDFHNWEYRCGREELSRIVAEKTGLDLGTIRELKALERGDSGRIVRIELVGDRGRAVIGKELAIRQALSRDCLKSSAFEEEWEGDTLVLHGRGWTRSRSVPDRRCSDGVRGLRIPPDSRPLLY